VSDYLTNLIGQQRPKNTVPVPTSTPALKLFPNSLQDAGNELLNNLGIAGRGLVQGAVSPITMVADPLTEFVNKTFGAKEKLPSQAVSEGLTALGVPQAKDDAQRILEAATGGLAGGGTIAKTAQLAGKGAGLAKGYLDTIGKDLAGQMTSGLGSGAGSVGASQAATASGASPVVAQLAGLGGGIVGGGARPVGSAKSSSDGILGFHGSKYGIDTIKPEKGYIGPTFFTDSKEIANNYAKGMTPTGPNNEFVENAGSFANKTITAKLNIKKPITENTTLEDVLGREEAQDIRSKLDDQEIKLDAQPFSSSMDDDSDISILAHLYAQFPYYKKLIEKSGSDGWIFKDMESGGRTIVPMKWDQVSLQGK